MKRFVLLACFCLSAGLPVGAFGETVLVEVAPGSASLPPVCLSAVESGIMDVLFGAGHIVFNDGGWNKDYPIGAPQGLTRAARIAKESGAGKILAVTLSGLVKADGTFRPTKLAYVVYRVSDQKQLLSGEIGAEGLGKENDPPQDIAAEMGKLAGAKALPVLSK
jgi:hypothetical protein